MSTSLNRRPMPKRTAPGYFRMTIYFSDRDEQQADLYDWASKEWRTWKKLDGNLAEGEGDFLRDLLAQLRAGHLKRQPRRG